MRPATSTATSPRTICVGVVADRDTTREALVGVLRQDAEFSVLGSAAGPDGGRALLAQQKLKVLLVNLPLQGQGDAAPGIEFIKFAKATRPNVGLLSLKRDVDEHLLRAALDAGADACCLATTSQRRLIAAIKAVAEGATWLDPEISRILFHPAKTTEEAGTKNSAPHLSPRELEILRLLTHGYTNEEIAIRLNSSPATVKTHLLHLFRKLDVRDRVSAAVSALRLGLL